MTVEEFEAAVQRYRSVIDSLSPEQQEQLLSLVQETRARHEQVGKDVRRAMDLVDDWRLHQKYALFDREASIREINSRGNPPDDANEDN